MLISGPVASGKTTLARGLAGRARAAGLPAAAIDMDEVIEMVAGSDWSRVHGTDRRRACRATAPLVQSFFDSGLQVVAIAGSTLSTYEWDEITRRLDPAPDILYVLLRVSVEQSVERTSHDPSRFHTRDPDFVEELAAAIDWSKVRKPDLEVDTDGMTAEQVLAHVAPKVGVPA